MSVMVEKGTDEMVQLLYATIHDALKDLGIKFSNGDIMAACTYIIVEAGLDDNNDPEKLLEDVAGVMRKIISKEVGGTALQ